MKSLIIDTSALVAVIANEPEKDKLIALTRDVLLIAPRSVYWEVGNAFSAMLKRGKASWAQVQSALQIFESIPVRYVDIGLNDALEIAQQHGIYAYDAYLLAAARHHRAPLLSLDQQMIRLGTAMGIRIMEV
jgi:predicted nucleic acid-binding protein